MTTAQADPQVNAGNWHNGVYYPETDGLPLPDGFEQEPLFQQVTPILRAYLQQHYDVIVSGDTFLYYEEGNPRRFVAPDCYVTFGVNRSAVRPYNSYFTWHVGIPDFVLEIASGSTLRQDLRAKPALYARLGIGEYWRYDATPDSRYYGTPLYGGRLVDGEYQPLPIAMEPGGMRRGHSPALGIDLCWDAGRLRFYDPARDVWVPDYYELLESVTAANDQTEAAQLELETTRASARSKVETARSDAAAARQEVETARSDAAAARQEVETARLDADTARQDAESARSELRAAEAQMAAMAAELRRLRGAA